MTTKKEQEKRISEALEKAKTPQDESYKELLLEFQMMNSCLRELRAMRYKLEHTKYNFIAEKLKPIIQELDDNDLLLRAEMDRLRKQMYDGKKR